MKKKKRSIRVYRAQQSHTAARIIVVHINRRVSLTQVCARRRRQWRSIDAF